jgi:integrase
MKAKRLPSGSYRVRLYIGVVNGKKKYVSITAETKKDAEYAAANYQPEGPKKDIITVKDAIERYIDSKDHILSPSTIREYRKMLRIRYDKLLTMPIESITTEVIQNSVNEACLTLSSKSIKNAYSLLLSSLKMFLPDKMYRLNYPKAVKKEEYIPTDDDVKKLLDQVQGTRAEAPIILAACASLRRSEIAALEPTDITDLGVSVTKAMVQDDKKQWVIKGTKTKAGTRFVPLAPEMIKIVRQWIPTVNPNVIYQDFSRALDVCDLPHFRFHALRHYYASTCHALGVPDKYIMANGGWESEQVLHGVYEHAMDQWQKQNNDKIVNYFSEKMTRKMTRKKKNGVI